MPTPLPSDPTVQLRFTGLLVFYYDGPNSQMIVKAVKAYDHLLRVLWVKKKREDGSIIQLTPLPENTGMDLRVVNPAMGHNTVEKHLCAILHPDPETEPNAYRHLLKFTDLPGNEGATIRPYACHGDITIHTGYFYSADNYEVRIGPGEDCSNNPPQSVSFMMGANLYFNAKEGGQATLTAGSVYIKTDLERATDSRYIYEIHITNLPHLGVMMTGNHFRHYYSAFDHTAVNPLLVCPRDRHLEGQASPSHMSPQDNRVNYMHPCIPVGI